MNQPRYKLSFYKKSCIQKTKVRKNILEVGKNNRRKFVIRIIPYCSTRV